MAVDAEPTLGMMCSLSLSYVYWTNYLPSLRRSLFIINKPKKRNTHHTKIHIMWLYVYRERGSFSGWTDCTQVYSGRKTFMNHLNHTINKTERQKADKPYTRYMISKQHVIIYLRWLSLERKKQNDRRRHTATCLVPSALRSPSSHTIPTAPPSASPGYTQPANNKQTQNTPHDRRRLYKFNKAESASACFVVVGALFHLLYMLLFYVRFLFYLCFCLHYFFLRVLFIFIISLLCRLVYNSTLWYA